MPRGGIAAVTILNGGTGYNNPIIVVDDAYGTGASFTIPRRSCLVSFRPPCSAVRLARTFSAPVATVIDDPALCGGGRQPACGTGALADAIIGGPVTGGIHKFVDTLPGLGPPAPTTSASSSRSAFRTRRPIRDSDYYVIGLVEYTEQMHSDLPATRLRGYVQIVPQGWTGTDALGNAYTAVPLTTANGLTQNITIGGAQAYGATKPHYLGPVLVAKGRAHGVVSPAGDPRPARVKFYNLLPTGAGGDLFLPVDEPSPGAGVGPVAGRELHPERATIHLHGNNTVWISDGNAHQWITPAGENTPYPKGVSARSVPDMAGWMPADESVTTSCPATAGA